MMNVYDFDGTIYYPDCTVSFALWCANRHPKLWFTFVPKAIKYLILYKTGKLPRHRLERYFFSFLGMIDDFDEQIENFGISTKKEYLRGILRRKSPMILS